MTCVSDGQASDINLRTKDFQTHDKLETFRFIDQIFSYNWIIF